jgi:hypothetical protein
MQPGPPEQPTPEALAYPGFRQIVSVTLRATVSQWSMATTAALWSTLAEGTNLEFRGEFFNLLNHPNFLIANSGPQNDTYSAILGTPQFRSETAVRNPRQIQLAF